MYIFLGLCWGVYVPLLILYRLRYIYSLLIFLLQFVCNFGECTVRQVGWVWLLVLGYSPCICVFAFSFLYICLPFPKKNRLLSILWSTLHGVNHEVLLPKAHGIKEKLHPQEIGNSDSNQVHMGEIQCYYNQFSTLPPISSRQSFH